MLACRRGKPVLEQHGRSPGVLTRAGVRAFGGDHRRKPLVVQVHGDWPYPFGEAISEIPRLTGLVCVVARESEWQPDHDAFDLALPHQIRHAGKAAACRGALDRLDRCRQCPGRIAERAAATSLAVVEREHSHHLVSACSMACLAALIASGSFSGLFPPAWAIVSLPP